MAGKNQKTYTAPSPEDRSGAQGFKPGKAPTPNGGSGVEQGRSMFGYDPKYPKRAPVEIHPPKWLKNLIKKK